MDLFFKMAKAFSDKMSTPIFVGGGAAYLTYVGTYSGLEFATKGVNGQVKLISSALTGLALSLMMGHEPSQLVTTWGALAATSFVMLHFGSGLLKSLTSVSAASVVGVVVFSMVSAAGFFSMAFESPERTKVTEPSDTFYKSRSIS